MVSITASTQTVLNFELLLHFLYKDLPRLISYDIVPLFFKIINNANERSDSEAFNYNAALQKQIEDVVKRILEQSLPKAPSVKDLCSMDKAMIQCNICQKTFRMINSLAEHLMSAHKNPPKITGVAINLDCMLCGYKSVDSLEYGKHLKEKHVENTIETRKTGIQATTIECPACKMTFPKYTKLIHHLTNGHPQQTSHELCCKFCRFSTTVPTELGEHIDKKHVNCNQGRSCFTCNICGLKFFCLPSFEKHRATHQNNVPKCPKCGVVFNFKSQVTSHLRFSATCGSEVKNAIPLELGPQFGHSALETPAPSAHQRKTANMIGSTLLNLLDQNPEGGGGTSEGGTPVGTSGGTHVGTPSATSGGTSGGTPGGTPCATSGGGVTSSNGADIEVTAVQPRSAAYVQTMLVPMVSDNLIMDTSTGRPVPVSDYLEKQEPRFYNAPANPSGPRHIYAKKYKCGQCGRAFGSLSVLNHHQVKVHVEKKSLSCTDCTRLFASFAELESHFYRVHKNKASQVDNNSSTSDSTKTKKTFVTNTTIKTEPVDERSKILADSRKRKTGKPRKREQPQKVKSNETVKVGTRSNPKRSRKAVETLNDSGKHDDEHLSDTF